ncbi:MAG: T9SS type A sorting domain-containing protein [Chitinophagaceae bacterium]|nr:T9SS type A sorting domain-containing protein [Chitinophagaceae bacterium]
MAAAPKPNIQLVNNVTTPVRDVSVTDLAVDVFPNPSVKSFIIKLNSSYTFQVFDTNGRLILQGNGNGTIETGNELQPGVYFLKIQSKKKSSTQKIIKK